MRRWLIAKVFLLTMVPLAKCQERVVITQQGQCPLPTMVNGWQGQSPYFYPGAQGQQTWNGCQMGACPLYVPSSTTSPVFQPYFQATTPLNGEWAPPEVLYQGPRYPEIIGPLTYQCQAVYSTSGLTVDCSRVPTRASVSEERFRESPTRVRVLFRGR